MITLNSGETASGVTLGHAGIEIDRGDLTNYVFIFDETQDNFRIGESSSPTANTQAVATREDSPVDSGVSYWNDALNRFDTSSNFLFDGEDISLSNNTSIAFGDGSVAANNLDVNVLSDAYVVVEGYLDYDPV